MKKFDISGFNKKYLAAAAVLAAALAVFVLWGPPAMLAKTSTPDYCNSCHVMNEQYEAWMLTGLHRNAKCVDCHLPNSGFIRHYIWKGIDGMKDLFMFHAGVYSERIGISDHGKNVLKENCVRCHEGMLTMIKYDGRDCWSCHRRVMHRFAPVITAR